MRKSKEKALEVEQAEFQRRENRNNGLSLAAIRDRGWVKLTNGSILEWHIDRPFYDGEVRTHVPEGMFMLDRKLFDVDEFRKFLRWS